MELEVVKPVKFKKVEVSVKCDSYFDNLLGQQDQYIYFLNWHCRNQAQKLYEGVMVYSYFKSHLKLLLFFFVFHIFPISTKNSFVLITKMFDLGAQLYWSFKLRSFKIDLYDFEIQKYLKVLLKGVESLEALVCQFIVTLIIQAPVSRRLNQHHHHFYFFAPAPGQNY